MGRSRAEIDRTTGEQIYERRVFFVRNPGFCEPTSARRISFQESLAFEKIQEQSYRAFGYELIDIPADDLAHRVAAIGSAISPSRCERHLSGAVNDDLAHLGARRHAAER